MNTLELLNQKYDDSYLEIALEQYLRFKQTDAYEEQYKYDALEELNHIISEKTISQENIVDVIKIYQKHNPQTGSFVHWSSLKDLLDFTEVKPERASYLLNRLFDDNLPLKDRIEEFYNEGKAYNSIVKFGTPLFGYLLAGYNRKEYPIYKDGVFNEFIKALQIEEKPVNISDKYELYDRLCHEIRDLLRESGEPQAGVLDAQDFTYCISGYDGLKVNIAVSYLHNSAKRLHNFKGNPSEFLEVIKQLDRTYLQTQHSNYKNTEKVNRIRYEILDAILSGQDPSLEDVQKIEKRVSRDYEKDILHAWNDFTILFPIYYNQYKEKIKSEMKKIHAVIRDTFKDQSFHKDKAIFDFMGPQNFGSSRCWLAVYPTEKKSHKEAAQLFLMIDEVNIAYGYNLGSGLKGQTPIDDLEIDHEIHDFSYDKMISKYKEVYPQFQEENAINAVMDGDGQEGTVPGVNTVEPEQIDIPDLDNMPLEIPEVNFANEIQVNNLYFSNLETILQQTKTALKNRKHIIFTGPPGTGKSKLAKAICEQLEVEYRMATGSSDWSTFDTIGGYRPKKDGDLYFSPGLFLNCFKDQISHQPMNQWLIIDEINRADIDKAFGPLFSALAGDPVTLTFQSESGRPVVLRPQEENEDLQSINDYEYVIPKDWRMIGTMNTLDKASLYEMSYAFMRRFAFIPVPVPKKIDDTLVKYYLDVWGVEDHNNLSIIVSNIWRTVNQYRQIGPAIIEDIVRYLEVDFDVSSAVSLFVIPQLEGMMNDEIENLIEQMNEIDGLNQDRLKVFAGDFFQ